jgi:hypothetical protein
MLRFFRVRAWCLATSLVLAVGTAGASLDVLLHGDAAHHADPCAPTLNAAHDEAAHRITATREGRADGADTHCVACHLARTPRLRSDPHALTRRPDDARTLLVPASIGVALPAVLSNLQPRSPPRVG